LDRLVAPSRGVPTEPSTGPTRARGGRLRTWLVPAAISEAHALAASAAGFLVEGGTELYQYAARGHLSSGPWWVYYLTLATTILGFYLMWRGLREWRILHSPDPDRRRRPVGMHSDPASEGRPARPRRWEAPLLFAGGTIATAGWGLTFGSGGTSSVPAPVVWLIGGVVVLAIGGFFLSLARLVWPFTGPLGRSIAIAAALWSLGTSVVAGFVIGRLTWTLLEELVTSWSALVTSLAPFVVAIAPLFVTYGGLTGVYVAAAYRLGGRRTAAGTV
jgi:hypothetical protein